MPSARSVPSAAPNMVCPESKPPFRTSSAERLVTSVTSWPSSSRPIPSCSPDWPAPTIKKLRRSTVSPPAGLYHESAVILDATEPLRNSESRGRRAETHACKEQRVRASTGIATTTSLSALRRAVAARGEQRDRRQQEQCQRYSRDRAEDAVGPVAYPI